MRVGFYQFRPLFGATARNTKKIIHGLVDAKADLIVLPELALTGYYFKDATEAKVLAEDPKHSPHIDSLINFCRDKKIHLVLGFLEKAKDKCFNSVALISPSGTLAIYRKLHLFNEEKKCMSPGDTPLQTYSLLNYKIGMMICFDWVFPEVSRTLAMQGAQIICHPSNLVLSYCQDAMMTRCLENHVFAITANRYGADKRPQGTLYFTGKSQIVSPKGVRLYRAPSQRTALHIADINPAESNNKQITQYNSVIADRRPEFYAL